MESIKKSNRPIAIYTDIDSMQFGKTIVTLKKIKEQVGHDDSLPFAAELYINDVYVGITYNDGWGADAIVEGRTSKTLSKEKLDEILKKADEEISLYDAKYKEYTLPYATINQVCDEIASFYFSMKPIVKRTQTNNIVYFVNDNGEPKVYTLRVSNVVKQYKENTPVLRQAINRVIANKGIIINTNIPKSYIDEVNIYKD